MRWRPASRSRSGCRKTPSTRGSGNPVQIQMGVESGEVVEIDGDCYGDAVNSAARLADLAGAEQILTTQRVRDALSPVQRDQLRSLGPMFLRGKSEATEVFRVDWRVDRDDDATVMGASLFKTGKASWLELAGPGQIAAPGLPRRKAHAGPRHRRVAVDQRRARVARPCHRGVARQPFRSERHVELRHLGVRRQPGRAGRVAAHRVLPGRAGADLAGLRTRRRKRPPRCFTR